MTGLNRAIGNFMLGRVQVMEDCGGCDINRLDGVRCDSEGIQSVIENDPTGQVIGGYDGFQQGIVPDSYRSDGIQIKIFVQKGKGQDLAGIDRIILNFV